jgi:membrane associated rhomboid family serine protease
MDEAPGGSAEPGGPPGATGDAAPALPASPPPPGAGLQLEPCYRHPGQITGVHCTRCGKPICVDCMRPAAVGYQCPDCLAQERSSGYRYQHGLTRTRPVVTQVLIAMNVGFFIAEILTGARLDASFSGSFGGSLIEWGALRPDHIAYLHEYWRLVSAMFLHGGLLHLGVNMYVLWVLGSVIEPAFGSKRFLAIYLIAGLFGSVASYTFSSPNVVGVGASGAIFGLLGAWVAYNLRRRGSPAAAAQLRWALLWIGINLVIGLTISGIDNFAHMGGLVGGLIAGFVAEGVSGRRDDVPIQIAGFVGMLLLAIILIAFRTQAILA